VVQRGRVPGRFAVALLVATVSLCSLLRYRALAGDWQHAGEISESLLTQLVQLEPAPPPGMTLHIADVPLRFGAAYVYITFFHYSVQQRYARPDLAIVTQEASEIPALVSDWNGSMPNVELFRWDAGTERLLRVWRRD
jgi:hypothetical protein